jgi:hypothetical protein
MLDELCHRTANGELYGRPNGTPAVTACNGWAFWHLETAAGLVSIDALRAEVRATLGGG